MKAKKAATRAAKPRLRRTTMRLDRDLKKRLHARARMEGRPFMRLLAMISREGLSDKAPLEFDATGYKPKREITTIRLSDDLLKRLSKRAAAEERSCANVVEILLHRALIERKEADRGTVFD